ncbi:hypothetical protein MPSEU_000772600 [Mayamaea pseudoterrestris]|nr:hypothetical protein MPSEU_000772600 [Mayamaea pseudoterrestris]
MKITFREPNHLERQWLALGSRGSFDSYLTQLDFKFIKKCYQHPLIDAKICKEFTCGENVLMYMVKHGIPNRRALGADLDQFCWWVRMCRVDLQVFKDANMKNDKGLTPQMVTHIATDASIMDILKKNKVIFENGRILLTGASTLPANQLVERVHYATSLEQLRTMLRETGSWLAPDAERSGARGSAGTVAEKLIIQMWAACGATPLPTFVATRNEQPAQKVPPRRHDQEQEIARVGRRRNVSTSEEEAEEEEEAGASASSSKSSRNTRPHPAVSHTAAPAEFDGEDDVDNDSDSLTAIQEQAARARGDKYKALAAKIMEKNSALEAKVAQLKRKRG